MEQCSVSMQQQFRYHHDNDRGVRSNIETSQQPWPFWMSRARPPGCTSPEGTTAVLNLRHSQQEHIIPSEAERILFEQSLRADGWLNLCKERSKIKLVDHRESSSLTNPTKLRFAEGGQAIRVHMADRHQRKGKRINESRVCIEDDSKQDMVFDTKAEHVALSLQSHLQDEEEENTRCCGNSTHLPTSATISMEEVFHALDKSTGLCSVSYLVYIMQKCRKEKDPMYAIKLHTHICKVGLETDAVIGNHLVPMFVECKHVLVAQQTFNKLSCHNEHSWSFLVLGYSTMGGQLHCALNVYKDMQKKDMQPSCFTFLGLVKACAASGNLEAGRFVHGEIKEKGFSEDVHVGNSLVDMYAKCGSLVEAEEAFQHLPVRDVVSWTALMAGYVEHELGQEALSVYHRMQYEGGISGNEVTVSLAVRACRGLEDGLKIHNEAMEKGYESDLSVSSGLLSMYTKVGLLNEAHSIFDKLRVRDVMSWNALIVACAEHGPYKEAIEWSEQMHTDGIAPDAVTFSSSLKACANLGNVEQGQEMHGRSAKCGLAEDTSVGNSLIGMYGKCGLLLDARKVFDDLQFGNVVSWTAMITVYAEHNCGEEALLCFEQMQGSGLVPNDVTYVCALKACGLMSFLEEGRELHANAARKGLDLELRVANTLVSMYAMCGSLTEALNIFKRIPKRSVVSWTALIGRYADCGSVVEAFKCFDRMLSEEILPNAVTFSCLLKACGSMGAADKGRELHAQILQEGFEGDPSVASALISMYAKCGSLSEARDVFDDIPVLNVVAWSSMIKAYAMSHDGKMAIACFLDMQAQGIKPDIVTFTCLLTACSHAGLIREGQGLFKVMREKYDIAPSTEHYSCMVDLLARSGDLYEAEKLLETFASPDEDPWAALLSACKSHGELGLGLRCFQQLLQRDPEDAAWYVLIADICRGAGRLQEGNMIEMLRKHAEVKKKRACAWIEVNEEVQEFMVGNDQSDDVKLAVRMLNKRLKDEGHIPNLDMVVSPIAEDDQKESALCEHAEKLAIAFGLLNTPQGSTLRVSKNLRMCADCHSASKMISKIEQREIILRDDCCMHHFKDGACACGDMF